MDDQFTAEDGSYVFPNITAVNTSHASDVGVEYYCTATNAFGTIRSPTVRAFYAGERENGCGWCLVSMCTFTCTLYIALWVKSHQAVHFL